MSPPPRPVMRKGSAPSEQEACAEAKARDGADRDVSRSETSERSRSPSRSSSAAPRESSLHSESDGEVAADLLWEETVSAALRDARRRYDLELQALCRENFSQNHAALEELLQTPSCARSSAVSIGEAFPPTCGEDDGEHAAALLRVTYRKDSANIAGRLLPHVDALPTSLCWVPVSRNVKGNSSKKQPVPYLGDDANLSFLSSEDVVRDDYVALSAQRVQQRELRRTLALLHEREFDVCDPALVFEVCRQVGCSRNGALEVANKAAAVPPEEVAAAAAAAAALELPIDADAIAEPAAGTPKAKHEKQYTSVEDVFDSYSALFCRRCFTYDCQMHGGGQPVPRAGPSQEAAQPADMFAEPCGPNCFRHSNSRKRRRASEDSWSFEERAIAERASVAFPNDYCKIAELIGSKSCVEVAEMLRGPAREHGDVDMDVDSYQGRNARRRRTKKVLRSTTVANHKLLKVRMEQSIQRMYHACSHEGSCSAAKDCACAKSGNFCEKFCACGPECTNRFQGCKCGAECRTRACPCFAANRECDPDICSCQGTPECTRCKNMNMLTNRKKRVLIGRSRVAGWGLFLAEDAQKGDFIGEYKGEVITHEEADRRGKIYDVLDRSYLFNLNDSQVVDATYLGNKMKFANHSSKPNCFTKIMLVNGDHRIGVFAKYPIRKGEELFFDYKYDEALAPSWCR